MDLEIKSWMAAESAAVAGRRCQVMEPTTIAYSKRSVKSTSSRLLATKENAVGAQYPPKNFSTAYRQNGGTNPA